MADARDRYLGLADCAAGLDGDYAREAAEALDAIDAIEAALADAIEGLEEMLPYVDDYFVKKWKLADYVTNAKAALDV